MATTTPTYGPTGPPQPCQCHGAPPFALATPRPYRCPVCGGRGKMPHGFYDRLPLSTSTEQELCRSCGGRGVVFA